MRKYESYNVRFDEVGADQFRADTLDEAKGWVLEQIREMKARTNISEENREYWLGKFANPIFVHRIVLEDTVE